MPVDLMTEATPAGREGWSAVRMGNESRSGPEVTAPSGGDTQEVVLHDHVGKSPAPRACQGRATWQRSRVRHARELPPGRSLGRASVCRKRW